MVAVVSVGTGGGYDDRRAPCLISYEKSRQNVRREGQDGEGGKERVVYFQEGEPGRRDHARLAEADHTGNFRGVRWSCTIV